MSFNYQQKHNAELNAAKRIAMHFSVARHEIITLPIGHLGGSALTDTTMEVEEYTDSTDIPTTYVPARNTIMLSIALGWAEILGADAIFTGVSAIDYSHYPDCRPEYIDAFQSLATLATKRGAEGNPIQIQAPLLFMTKAKTIELGLSLGVDYTQTVSCYRATDEGLACGTCNSCHLRKKGFLDANQTDMTRYR
jgi:7-cyano-7-deazaguanine synthase